MITIFTATYNRAYILPQLYASLKRQTSKEFEWIVVDDGSKDNTKDLFYAWENDSEFTIKYIKKENGGKHRAINYGVRESDTEWFFIVDSDDFLVKDAVEKINKWIENIDLESKKIAGVSGTCISKKGVIIGGEPKLKEKGYIDAKNNERAKYTLGGDKAEIYRTSVLKKYPFPEYDGEKFISECVVWDQIAIDGYYLRWYPDPLVVVEYLSDGLSASVTNFDLELKNFAGYTNAVQVRLKAYKGAERIRIACQYINKAMRKKITNDEMASNLEMPVHMVLILKNIVKIKKLVYKRLKE